MQKVRRVVAGQAGKDGTTVVVDDREIDSFALDPLPGHWHAPLWAGEGIPELPYTSNTVPESFPMVVGPGSWMFGVLTIEPESSAELHSEQTISESFMHYPDAVHPRMHGGDGFTFMAVIEGEIWIELDSGEEFHLRQGDTYLQLGVRKAYWNRSDQRCRLSVSSIAARRVS